MENNDSVTNHSAAIDQKTVTQNIVYVYLSEEEEDRSNDVECPKCKRKFAYQKVLDKHRCESINLVHLHDFFCMICKRVFKSRTAQNSHKCHNTLIETGIEQDFDIKPKLQYNGKIFCENCQHMFNSIRNYNRHSCLCPLVCAYCRKRFRTEDDLEAHECLLHECEICRRIFNSPLLLKRHRPNCRINCSFYCIDCNRGFARRVELNSHGCCKTNLENIICCRYCTKELPNEESLKLHQCQMYLCEYCESAFVTKQDLRIHVCPAGAPMQYKPVMCPMCSKVPIKISQLFDHVVNDHANEIPVTEHDDVSDIKTMLQQHHENSGYKLMLSHQRRHEPNPYFVYRCNTRRARSKRSNNVYRPRHSLADIDSQCQAMLIAMKDENSRWYVIFDDAHNHPVPFVPETRSYINEQGERVNRHLTYSINYDTVNYVHNLDPDFRKRMRAEDIEVVEECVNLGMTPRQYAEYCKKRGLKISRTTVHAILSQAFSQTPPNAKANARPVTRKSKNDGKHEEAEYAEEQIIEDNQTYHAMINDQTFPKSIPFPIVEEKTIDHSEPSTSSTIIINEPSSKLIRVRVAQESTPCSSQSTKNQKQRLLDVINDITDDDVFDDQLFEQTLTDLQQHIHSKKIEMHQSDTCQFRSSERNC